MTQESDFRKFSMKGCASGILIIQGTADDNDMLILQPEQVDEFIKQLIDARAECQSYADMILDMEV